MRMHLGLAVSTLLCGLSLPASAESGPADCRTLSETLEAFTGLGLSAPPAGDEGGWCVFDGAVLAGGGADQPDIWAKRLRLRGTEANDVPESLELDLTGLRVTPKIGDTEMDDRLRSLFRLQTADLSLAVSRNHADDRLELSRGRLVLSGGTEVEFSADLAGSELSATSVLLGALTALDLTWKNDGRLLRPVMEVAGEHLVEGATGSVAVDATRDWLQMIAAALPSASLTGTSGDEAQQLIAALPQGRGRLRLGLVSDAGIGAAQLGLVALAEDPLGAKALERLLSGSRITLDWRPGLVP
jgi:hypothetical protein